jgi:hypothetical protein
VGKPDGIGSIAAVGWRFNRAAEMEMSFKAIPTSLLREGRSLWFGFKAWRFFGCPATNPSPAARSSKTGELNYPTIRLRYITRLSAWMT